MSKSRLIPVRPRRDVREWLERLAAADGITVPTLISRMLLQLFLEQTTPHSMASLRARAELRLLEWVGREVDQLRAADAWDEHVTLMVFKRIELEAADLYAAAAAEQDRGPLHRRIGSLVRERLGAEVKMSNGRKVTRQPMRSEQSLIKTYTLLCRPKNQEKKK